MVRLYSKEVVFFSLYRHDVHCTFFGQAARDVSRHFVQRWNFVKQAKYRDRDDNPLLLPPDEVSDANLHRYVPSQGNCRLQIIRSASQWSMGTARETSILEAYMHCINYAEHYIYVENQFFVSRVDDSAESSAIRNQIAKAICDRIIRASLNNRPFRVFVVLPLLPAFESEVSHVNAATTRLIMHWHHSTFWKNEFSMIEYLRSAGVDSTQYLSFCSLRTHGRLGQSSYTLQMNQGQDAGPLVTEQVYVHSKMLIVDDRVSIIGSANINDRSMMGNRDSEVAVYIEDEEMVPSMMNGKPYQAGSFSRGLRLRLFREHLGISDDSLIMDPLSESFFRDVWLQTAAANTAIYRDLFRCTPDDNVANWDLYQQFLDTPFRSLPGHLATRAPMQMVQAALDKIRGHLVFYPLRFLSDENLSLVFPAKEFIIPMDVFV